MKTISILGAGWLGLPLAEELNKNGYNIISSSRSGKNKNYLSSIGIQHIDFDLENIQANTDSIKQIQKSDILIIAIPSRNTEGFQTLASVLTNSSIQHILFVSTTSVYANCNCEIIHPIANQAKSPYIAIENTLQKLKGISTTILRFAGLFGYERDPGRYFSNKPIPNPTAPVNMIHRDDCIQIILEIIQQQKWKEIYHAAAPSHPSKADFYGKNTLRFSGKKVELSDKPITQPSYKIINSQKLEQDLNYKFLVSDLMDW